MAVGLRMTSQLLFTLHMALYSDCSNGMMFGMREPDTDYGTAILAPGFPTRGTLTLEPQCDCCECSFIACECGLSSQHPGPSDSIRSCHSALTRRIHIR